MLSTFLSNPEIQKPMILPPIQRFLLIFLTLSIVGCQETPGQNSANTKLVITGSSTIAPLVSEMGKRFETKNSRIRIDVQTGGSSRGISDIRQNLANIGMVSRALTTNEGDLHGTVIAYDGIGLIVHRSNSLKALDPEAIRGIYTGLITNWKDVGGIDAPITVVNKAEGRGTLDLFLHYFQLQNSHIKAHVVIGDNEQGIKTVAGNPYAIAYVSIGTAEYDAAHGIAIKLLRLGNIPASLKTVREGRYPLSRPLTLITNEAPMGSVKAFIDFAKSPEVHDLVTQHYFVPFTG
jgi:phosphate transport system substrate-binding protein